MYSSIALAASFPAPTESAAAARWDHREPWCKDRGGSAGCAGACGESPHGDLYLAPDVGTAGAGDTDRGELKYRKGQLFVRQFKREGRAAAQRSGCEKLLTCYFFLTMIEWRGEWRMFRHQPGKRCVCRQASWRGDVWEWNRRKPVVPGGQSVWRIRQISKTN